MKEVKLKSGRYSLKKEGGRGDSGNMWSLYDGEKTMDTGEYHWLDVPAGTIRVGCGIRVMSLSSRDLIQCSPVTEILEVNEDKTQAKVKTQNSIYIVSSF
jgi:hypothetical protein